MTRLEFVQRIDLGNDIMFDVDGISYSVIGSAANGPNIAEQDSEKNEAEFRNGRDLLRQYKVNGKTLDELFDRIVITHCT